MLSARHAVLVPVTVGLLCSVGVAAVALASSRSPVLVTLPSATTSTAVDQAILTSGDATVSVRPDLAIVSAGVDSQQGTAAAAQSDLASKGARLTARIKALGVPDGDVTTSGYWVGPVYGATGQTVVGYRATEQLQVKWHNVDSVGRAIDAIVQAGGATNLSVGFGLNDPKAAQASARTLAVHDARSKAEAMASAAGVKVGQVVRISDLAMTARPPMSYAMGAAAPATQLPVGTMDVEVTVEVDYAIA